MAITEEEEEVGECASGAAWKPEKEHESASEKVKCSQSPKWIFMYVKWYVLLPVWIHLVIKMIQISWLPTLCSVLSICLSRNPQEEVSKSPLHVEWWLSLFLNEPLWCKVTLVNASRCRHTYICTLIHTTLYEITQHNVLLIPHDMNTSGRQADFTAFKSLTDGGETLQRACRPRMFLWVLTAK